MLTLNMLKAMPPKTIFATGTTKDPSIYEKEVRWIAIRGGIHDWAIYYHNIDRGIDYISSKGDKLHNRLAVLRLVPADKEALDMYRD